MLNNILCLLILQNHKNSNLHVQNYKISITKQNN